jgi:hypothetical protein
MTGALICIDKHEAASYVAGKGPIGQPLYTVSLHPTHHNLPVTKEVFDRVVIGLEYRLDLIEVAR